MGADADVSVDRLSVTPRAEDAELSGTSPVALPGLRLRQWDGETACLVFVPQSNSTHLLTREAGQLLRAATEGRLDLATADPSIVAGLLAAGLLRRTNPW